jgi:hypothetical protein
MELKDFIKSTLTQITLGVKEAQDELLESGVIINPSCLESDSKGNKYLQSGGVRYVQEIEINVGIVATNEGGKKASIGVLTGLLSGGIQANEGSCNQSVNNIKFTIPVALPSSKTPEGQGNTIGFA